MRSQDTLDKTGVGRLVGKSELQTSFPKFGDPSSCSALTMGAASSMARFSAATKGLFLPPVVEIQ